MGWEADGNGNHVGDAQGFGVSGGAGRWVDGNWQEEGETVKRVQSFTAFDPQ